MDGVFQLRMRRHKFLRWSDFSVFKSTSKKELQRMISSSSEDKELTKALVPKRKPIFKVLLDSNA